MSFYDSTGARGYELVKPYSEKTAEMMDQEVRSIVADVEARTREILVANDAAFRKVAELLLEKEVIMATDLEAILGPKVKPVESVNTTEPTSNEESLG